MERTPPRSRRLSIETSNGIVRNDRESKTPTVPSRSRRSSLEGPSSYKKEDICKPRMVLVQRFGQPQDFNDTTAQIPKDPRSPTSVSYQKRAKTDINRSQIPSLQPPKTPESQIRFRNEAQITMQNELTFSIDYQTPNAVNCSTNGKGSQIRRTFRTTIGKLINGSEKRFGLHFLFCFSCHGHK